MTASNIIVKTKGQLGSVESWFQLCQRFMPCQLSEDNRHIVLPLFLVLLHAKDIWRNMSYFPAWPTGQLAWAKGDSCMIGPLGK